MKTLLLLCFFVSVCCLPSASACEYPRFRVACVGDSLTTGNYPQVLQKLLGDDFEVRVYARKNRTVSSAQNELLFHALKYWNPTHVVFYAGINDCLMPGKSVRNSSWVIGQLEQTIVQIQDKGVQAVIVKHHPWDGFVKSGYKCSLAVNKWLDQEYLNYDPATIVETSSLGYPNQNRSNELYEKYDAGDHLHLNYEGDKLLAQLVAGVIQ